MSTTPDTLAHLDSQREIWDRKPLIRALYREYHEYLLANCTAGTIVEIGAGCGNLKSSFGNVISVDIVPSAWVDIVADGQSLPLRDDSVDNLVMLDVLHHIPRPIAFLKEAARVLSAGGRVVMLEPGITLLSRPFYTHFHPEPVDMQVDVFAQAPLSSAEPFDSNQAIPTLMFSDEQLPTTQASSGLDVVTREWLGPFSYPLSGGFRPWQMLSAGMLHALLRAEKRLPEWLRARTAFRLLVVLEKSA